MISTLQLNNFQSHKSTTLDFHPGVNVIVGSSDSGKSALVRALYWLTFNKPSGDAFCSDWGGMTEVIVHLSTKEVIHRFKTASKNGYIVDGLSLEAFGQGTPREVDRVMRLGPLNWQQQLDSPFILSESPGEVGRMLNRVVNLDVIDGALSEAAARIKKVETEITQLEGREYTLQKELDTTAHLSDLSNGVEAVEAWEDSRERLTDKVATLSDLTKCLALSQNRLADFGWVEGAQENIKELFRIEAEWGLAYIKKGTLHKLAVAIYETGHQLALPSPLLEASPRVKALGDQIADFESRRHTLDALKTALESLSAGDQALARAEEGVIAAEAAYGKVKPDICPLCGGVMK